MNGVRLSGAAAIVGIAETEYLRGADELPVEMMLRVAQEAIADAGLQVQDIDGVMPPPGYTTVEELAANLGIPSVAYSATVHMGGASSVAAVQDAAMAVATGVANNVLVVVGWNGYSVFRERPGARRPRRGMDANAVADVLVDFYLPYGARSAAQFYGWIATRHQQLYGTLPTDLGEVAVAFREHAASSQGVDARSADVDGGLPRESVGQRAVPSFRLLRGNGLCRSGHRDQHGARSRSGADARGDPRRGRRPSVAR